MMMEKGSRFKRKAVNVQEALDTIRRHIRLLETETIPLSASYRRRLARDLFATCDLPPFPRSGLDGYAVHSGDVADPTPRDPVILSVVGEVAAGEAAKGKLQPGEAVRIMTGAHVPEGADAVVMFEQTEEFTAGGARYVRIKHPVQRGQNIAKQGEEVRRGERLMARGTKIEPGQAALLAAFGYEYVPVYRRPQVAIFATGDELVDVGAEAVPGKIRNSNSYMLCAQVEHYGGIARNYGIIPDDLAIVRAAIAEALRENDLVITSGGVSVGDHDVMAELFCAFEGEILFNKVAMRPGSPTTAAVANGRFLFALSGNPGACFVGFELFVRPVLLGMQGASPTLPWQVAELAADYGKGSPYERFVRGRIDWLNERALAYPLGKDKASATLSIGEANGLIVIPPGKKGARRGEKVRFLPLPYEIPFAPSHENPDGYPETEQ
ncbi:molybdopterin molybdotransferase MoeA [Bacillaceae bacterium]